MIEVCFLIGDDDTILWADASDSPSALPDSRARWEAIWRHRDRLALIAHSHPLGLADFSDEDRRTMAAIDDALGRPLAYAVVTHGEVVATIELDEDPWWAALLRLASGMKEDFDGNPEHYL
ncbi:MAG TPA: Mov34/MPN/PAD-1 family protein [Kofleriaceae bacterium]|jgi:proteasome lid subunit RPN8/RPN11